MPDDIDRILSEGQEVIPSSTFVRNVMASVRREASTPAAVEFPWFRILPALMICAAALTALLIISIAEFRTGALVTGPTPRVLAELINFAKSIGLGWMAVALVAAFAPTPLVFVRK